MPRTLDADERNRVVSEAAWRVLVRDGIPALSVRKIAAEAGLPASSLRYTFPTQASVRARAFELVVERLAARVAAIPPGDGWATAALMELLPLDETRRLEMEVGLALGTAAMTDPSLRTIHHAVHQAIRDICEQVVTRYVPLAERTVEAQRLHALTDGLALHIVRQEPHESTDWAVSVLDLHLTSLTNRGRRI
ncbi:TetR/AcrR family transcriptional regulator [Cryptosporangium aurantiacum]|uniref:Transcriptional regulator, TetR family n=1 Tax=Cryptosporangium aurantiacum TaxID=134849 RepID=A0A1M7RLI5_9ACTN|nr:TetR family transcriptional regulator C-terminal domain-containing protein [Cryptosporangium aurantiacum]SHN47163.1 transcriptional regulator, TetR family [Cryptosporangium aurantiacum]